MRCNIDFYALYENYLHEPGVQLAHKFVFNTFGELAGLMGREDVLDLGCGHSQEYARHGSRVCRYWGVDVDPQVHQQVLKSDTSFHLTTGDYRDILTTQRGQGVRSNFENHRDPNVFVSLFSTEITAPVEKNYALYEHLFRTEPRLEWGLVSGLYYIKLMDQNPVTESGGLVIYQTLEPLGFISSPYFSEMRLVLPVPSESFGEDVVEVWKIFHRNLTFKPEDRYTP